jgi:alcohol dehydrogenase class IV
LQKIYSSLERLLDVLRECKPQKTLLVCDSAFEHLSFNTYITKTIGSYALFNGFTSNPLYEDVVNGVQLFNEQGCDLILAVGGGSAMDVAKCIKLYSERNVPLVAVPTTAGTGSESTRFAVIYKDGEKQSVSHDSILPDYVILEHYALRSLPIYQRNVPCLTRCVKPLKAFGR